MGGTFDRDRGKERGRKMKQGGLFIVLFVAFSSFLVGCFQAVMAETSSQEEVPDNVPLLDEQQEKTMDDAQDDASSMLLDAARWVDSFFEDERAVIEDNHTRAKIKLGLGYSKNDDFAIKPRLDLRLRLPGFSHRANLLIEAAEDSDLSPDDTPLAGRAMHQDSDKSEFTAALQYFLTEGKKYNLSLDTGASWHYLFAGLRYRASQDFGSWQGQFTDRLRYYTDDGWENRFTYDLDTELAVGWLFRAASSINVLEGVAGIPHAQQFRVYHVLGYEKAISYDFGVYFDTEPSYKLTDTQFVVKYRRRFYRDWLSLEISPRITFPEEYDRQANPGIVVSLEAVIGYKGVVKE